VITLACWLLSVAAMLTVAVLGPSAAIPSIPGSAGWPPYSLSVGPSDGVVYAIEALAAVTGAVATWRLLTAQREGQGADPRWLHAGGFLVACVLTLLPPSGADIKNYIAYGEQAASGVNPYTSGPQSPGVPQTDITRSVESPWQTTPTIYGPVFTRISAVIAHVAHGDGHLAVTLTRLFLTGAFILTGIALYALSTTAGGRRRTAVMWSANPLLLFTLVEGAHVDVLVAAPLVCSIALARRYPLAAGAAVGLAATIKLTGLVVLPGVVWAARQRLRSSVLIVVGACAFALPWIAITSGAFTQLVHASRFTTPAAPWRAVASLLEPALGYATARSLIGAVAGALGLVLVAVLLRRGLPPASHSAVGRAAAITAAFAIGWLLTAPYVLPWYDALAWAPLALVGASFLDRVLLVHTTALVLAFLPGRDVALASGADLANRVVHAGLSPVTLAVLIVVTACLAVRYQRAGHTTLSARSDGAARALPIPPRTH
jgi:alpha-1,6-mannosyltransferase